MNILSGLIEKWFVSLSTITYQTFRISFRELIFNFE